jgi:hypothetical protein
VVTSAVELNGLTADAKIRRIEDPKGITLRAGRTAACGRRSERGNDPEKQTPLAHMALVFPDRCLAQPRAARSASPGAKAAIWCFLVVVVLFVWFRVMS